MSDAVRHQVIAAGRAIVEETRVEHVAVGVLTLLALGLRLYTLPRLGVPTDEAITLWFVTRLDFAELLVEMPQTQPHYPLYYVLLKAWLDIVGSTAPVYARLPSVGAGVATVIVVYLLGSELKSSSAGILAATFVAVSPFFVAVSQWVRMYALFVFVTAVSWWCLLRLVRTDGGWMCLGYAVATIAMVFTHYFGLLFLVAQGTYLVWRDGFGLPKRLAGGMAVIGAPAALWVVYRIVWAATSSNRANVIGIPHRGIQDWVRIGLQPWLGQHLAMEIVNQQWRFLAPALVVVGVLFGVALWRTRRIPDSYAPLVAWVCLPTAAIVAYSAVRTPILRPRYVAAATLGGFVALAVMVDSFPKGSRIVAALLLVGGAVAGLPAGYHDTGEMGWVGGLQYVNEHADAGDTVVVSSPLPKAADYHLSREGTEADLVVESPPDAVSWGETTGEVWVVWRHPPPEAWAAVEAELEVVAGAGGYRIESRHVSNKVVVYRMVERGSP